MVWGGVVGVGGGSFFLSPPPRRRGGGGGGGRESVYIPLGLLSFPHGDIFSKIRMHQVIVTKKNRLEEERTK